MLPEGIIILKVYLDQWQIRKSPERVLVKFKWIKWPSCFPNIDLLTISYHITGPLGKKKSYLIILFYSLLLHKQSKLKFNHHEEFKDGKVVMDRLDGLME